jgi:hypothetical protein
MSYDFIQETGVIISDTSTIQAEVEAEFKAIFGTNFITDADTPEGQVINQIVQVRKNVSDNNAQLANQINPNEAGGLFIDAIWALTDGERSAATSTTVDGIMVGVAGTLIPAGSLATDGTNQYALDVDVELPLFGFFQSGFTAVETGPISLGAGEMDTIVTDVPGWETVSNGLAGNPGSDLQSDVSAKNERRVEIGLQGISMAESVFAKVQAVEFVQSLSFRDNVEPIERTIDGIVMRPNSVYVSVDAGPSPTIGTRNEIGAALLESKTGGADWTGFDESFGLQDPFSGQFQQVRFDYTDYIRVYVQVTISSSSTTSNPTKAVTDAVVAYALGEIDSEDPGLVTGTPVAPPEIGAAIGVDAPGVFTLKIEVSYDDITYTQDLLAIAIDERATVAAGDVRVVIQ